jgi:D-sedoheptulose 7-phosphate isomerase
MNWGIKPVEQIVLDILAESIQVKEQCIRNSLRKIAGAAEIMAECLAAGNKILLFGNGGSAADAQHIAAEFINRFQMERRPLAAVALTTDTSVLTSIANDYLFDDIFLKQVQALGRKKDVALGFSTSGNSTNVVKAVQAAKDIGMHTIGLTGRGGKLAEIADLVFTVPSDVTARIQETHITIGHILCDLVEKTLFTDTAQERS